MVSCSKFLPRRGLNFAVGFGLCALIVTGIVWSTVHTQIVQDLQLTVAETLVLVPTNGRTDDARPDFRYRWFKAANQKANPELRRVFANPKFPRQQVTVAAILAYTGGEEDARFLIEFLRKTCAKLGGKDYKQIGPDQAIIIGVYESLGLMARRGVVPAQRFITDVAKGKDLFLIPIANHTDMTIEVALTCFAYMQPVNLEATAEAALKRASPSMRDRYTGSDWIVGLRWVEDQESRPIWRSELRDFRLRVANQSVESKSP